MWGIKLTSEYISKLNQRFGTEDEVKKPRMCDGCGKHFDILDMHPTEGDCLICVDCLYEEMCDGHNPPHPTLEEFKEMLK